MTDGYLPQAAAWNQKTYQRLKFAFELGLKRQIFVAVCDDWTQTDALAARLQSEIGPRVGRSPRLVSLNLHASHPNPIVQIRHWLDDRAGARAGAADGLFGDRHDAFEEIPGFQILGAETLIRQSASVQWSFLENLRRLPEHLAELDASILFWMSRPWRYTIARSTPEFWRYCTSIFEFTGEPTPRRIAPISIARDPSVQTVEVEGRVTQSEPPDGWDGAIVPPSLARSVGDRVTAGASLDTSLTHGDVRRLELSFAELSHALEPQLVANVRETFQLVASPGNSPQQVLVRLFELKRARAAAADLAAAYQELGTMYRDRLDAEDPDLRCVTIAIQAFECALAGWQSCRRSEAANPELDWQLSALGNEIGMLYWMVADRIAVWEERQLALQRSAAAYRYALERLDEDEQPVAWATLQDSIGSVCSDLAQTYVAGSDPAVATWQAAIAAFEAALQYQMVELDPLQFATIHSNLGTACWNLAQVSEPAFYLERAVLAYQTALEFFTAERDPMNFAMLQTNLGTAAWNLAYHDRPRERLSFAIHCYRQALQYRTAETHPRGCAATQNNLGTAYWALTETFDPRTSREALISNLRQSIHAYETAIALAQTLGGGSGGSGGSLGFDLNATHDNLGMSYAQLATFLSRANDVPERQHCYERAIEGYVRAIEGYGLAHPRYDSIVNALTAALRELHDRIGFSAQNRAFSGVPAPVLADVMKRL